MNRSQVLRQAQTERLTLLVAANKTGYLCVSLEHKSARKTKPYTRRG